MATLKFVGTPAQFDNQPGNPNDIVDQSYVSLLLATNLTSAQVAAEIALDLTPYATNAYATAAMANLATPAWTRAQVAQYVSITSIDAANGPVGLNTIGQIPQGLISAPSTQQWPSPFWSPGGYQTVSRSATTSPIQLYTVAIPYPGYTYTLACFGLIDAMTTADDGSFPEVLVRAGAPSTTLTGTVSYDATGAGYNSEPNSSSATGSWSHTATAGAAVIVTVATYIGNGGWSSYTSTATYGGVGMTSLGAVNAYNSTYGWVQMFGLLNAPGGAQTVSFNIAPSGRSASAIGAVLANSASYVGAQSFGTAVGEVGNRTSMASGTITTPTGGMVVQAFTANGGNVPTFSNYSQASRDTDSGGSGGYSSGYVSYVLGDAPGPAVFTATDSGNNNWASIAVPLTPAPLTGYAGDGQIIAFGYGCGENYTVPAPGQIASQAFLNTAFTAPAAWTTVAGLVPVNNASYTSTMVGNFLQVPVTATVTLSASFTFAGGAGGGYGGNLSTSIQIIDNAGHIIAQGATVTTTSGTLTVSWTGAVTNGQLYGVQISETNASTYATISAGTFTISPATVQNSGTVNIMPVPFEDQVPLTAATTLYVMLQSSNSSTQVTASTLLPSLYVMPIPWSGN